MPTLTDSATTLDSPLSVFLDSSLTSSAHTGIGLNRRGDGLALPIASQSITHHPVSHIPLMEALEENWRYYATIQPNIDSKIIAALSTGTLVLYFETPQPVTCHGIWPNDPVPHLPPHTRAVTWIQDAAGMSEQRLADLLDVTRITIRNWKAGGSVRQHNHVERLYQIRDVLERAQQSYPRKDELSAWLATPSLIDGITPESLLRHGDFDKARALALLTKSDVAPTPYWAQNAESSPWAHNLEAREKPGELSET